MTTLILYAMCAAVYAVLAASVLMNVGRRRALSRSGLWLSIGCVATAAWALAGAIDWHQPLEGPPAQLDLVRAVVWYGFILHLYRRVAQGGEGAVVLRRALATMAVIALVAAVIAAMAGHVDLDGRMSLESGGVVLRLALAICQLLLIENLYRNAPDDGRWNINLTCLGLGGLAAFDVLVCADAALFHVASRPLVEARPAVAMLIAPLLAVAAVRNRRWEIDVHVSRSAVFHSATLVLSGVFLLALALAGEVARQFSGRLGAGWGGVAEISLLFAGVMTVAVLLASASARSTLRRMVVDHFFTTRFDYRQEWIRCVETLSGGGAGVPLHRRVIRAVVQVVDSPGGVLLLRERGEAGMHWAGSWNMPPIAAPFSSDHPLLARLVEAGGPLEINGEWRSQAPLDVLDAGWLAVPLLESGTLAGCIIAARPRAPFRLDHEVFDLLRILAHEACSYLAEQRAARIMVEARELREYGQRFAFVAHDIKNVSSQLSLLLSNAETHLANPDFQRDMLATVRASVQKIGALIRRLQASDDPLAGVASGGVVALPERLRAMAEAMERVRGHPILVEQDGWRGQASIAPASFDMILTHLMDNAIEASPPSAPVRLRLAREAASLRLEIIDQGSGMTPEFVRDELFRPFRTSKAEGSGIGAYQARALLREAGGDLQVVSVPGRGTTLRLLLPIAVVQATSAPALSV